MATSPSRRQRGTTWCCASQLPRRRSSSRDSRSRSTQGLPRSSEPWPGTVAPLGATVPVLRGDQRMLRLMSLSSLVLLLLVHGGCASGTASAAARGTPIAVTDVGMVVGRWAGLSDLPGHRNDDEYVEVTLHDDGTYEATSARPIGFM